MKIIIQFLHNKNKSYKLDVNGNETIKNLKQQLYINECIPPEQQRYFYKNEELIDNKKVTDYGIGDNHVIYFTFNLKG